MNNVREMKKRFIKDAGYEPSREELMEYIKNNEGLNINNQVQNNGDKLIGWLVIIWFVLSIFSLLGLANAEKEIEMMVIFGHYFLVFGLMALISNLKKINTDTAYKILFSVGIVFVLYIDFFSKGIKIKMSADMFMFFVLGSIFFVTGLVMVIFTFKKKDNPSLVNIDAKVCDYVKSNNLVACVYEYDFNGVNYKVTDNYFTNINVPEIGTIKSIKINQDNPKEIHTSGPGLLFLLIAIPFLVMGGLFIIVSFMF